MSGLIVSFFGSVSSLGLNLNFVSSEAVIVHIDEVCIEIREFYGL